MANKYLKNLLITSSSFAILMGSGVAEVHASAKDFLRSGVAGKRAAHAGDSDSGSEYNSDSDEEEVTQSPAQQYYNNAQTKYNSAVQNLEKWNGRDHNHFNVQNELPKAKKALEEAAINLKKASEALEVFNAQQEIEGKTAKAEQEKAARHHAAALREANLLKSPEVVAELHKQRRESISGISARASSTTPPPPPVASDVNSALKGFSLGSDLDAETIATGVTDAVSHPPLPSGCSLVYGGDNNPLKDEYNNYIFKDASGKEGYMDDSGQVLKPLPQYHIPAKAAPVVTALGGAPAPYAVGTPVVFARATQSSVRPVRSKIIKYLVPVAYSGINDGDDDVDSWFDISFGGSGSPTIPGGALDSDDSVTPPSGGDSSTPPPLGGSGYASVPAPVTPIVSPVVAAATWIVGPTGQLQPPPPPARARDADATLASAPVHAPAGTSAAPVTHATPPASPTAGTGGTGTPPPPPRAVGTPPPPLVVAVGAAGAPGTTAPVGGAAAPVVVPVGAGAPVVVPVGGAPVGGAPVGGAAAPVAAAAFTTIEKPAIAPSTPKPVLSSAKMHGAIAATSGISSDIANILSDRAASPVSIMEIAASGDEATNRKLWAKAFGSKGTQKSTNAAKSNSFGMTIGGDIDLLNDTMLLGAAFTHAKLNVKVKDEATVRANVNMASIYARHDILKRAFVTSSVSYGFVDVKNLTFSGSKNKARAFKANANLGYKITLKNGALVTPKIGLSYDNVQIKKLKPAANAKGIKANMDRVSTDLSLSVAKNFKVSDDLNLRPSANIGLNHIHHQNKLIDKTDALVASPNAPKTSYNAGVSVLASGNNAVSLDLGYNFNWKAKYRAHSGFAKLEIKF
jgi:outer membrane autotransporter protein